MTVASIEKFYFPILGKPTSLKNLYLKRKAHVLSTTFSSFAMADFQQKSSIKKQMKK
jgi:hypothetical protein